MKIGWRLSLFTKKVTSDKSGLIIKMEVCVPIVLMLASLVTLSEGFIYRNRVRTSKFPSWETPKLPEIRNVTVVQTRRIQFHGRVPKGQNTTCGKECQMNRTTKPISTEQLEDELAFETFDMDKLVVTSTRIKVGDVPEELYSNTRKDNSDIKAAPRQDEFDTSLIEDPLANVESLVLNRRKRNIFGLDTRFSLSSRRYMTMYPFSTAVKLSTGCSGVLLSPKHVLTSAHCIHDGKRYVKGFRKLKVGKQMESVQKQRKGKKNKKHRRRNRKGKKSRRNQVDEDEGASTRTKRDLSMRSQPIAPYFKWVRARKTHLPQGWLRAASRNKNGEFPIEYDYAVIELRRSLGNESMEVGMSPDMEDIPSGHRIHFTGFDTDRSNQMLYRFCPIEDESPDLMYHYCDAQEGTSGAGIYIRLFDRASGRWSRRVVAVFSGHQWVNFPSGAHKEFNTGVRITPLKYAQICYWTKGSYEQCRGG